MSISPNIDVSEYQKELSKAKELKEAADAGLMGSNCDFSRYEEAIRTVLGTYDKASGLSGSDYICYLEKAKIYLELGESKNAYQSILDAEKFVTGSSSSTLLLALSEMYNSLGYPEIASEKLNEVAVDSLPPDEDIKYYCNYANLLFNTDNYGGAIRMLGEGIDKVEGHRTHVLYYLIGIALKKMPYTSKVARLQNIQGSIENYVKAIGLLTGDPDFNDTEDQCRLLLGKYYRALGKRLKELDVVDSCSEKTPVEREVKAIINGIGTCLRKKYGTNPRKPTSDAQFFQIAALDLYEHYPVLKRHVDDEYSVDPSERIYDPSIYPFVVKQIMESESMKKIEDIVFENKAIQKNFLTEKYRLQCQGKPTLHILQHWNSYTPIISEDDVVGNGRGSKNSDAGSCPNTSKGGGYYIDTGEEGVVIDPGFDFIKNFKEAGFFFNDIDTVLLTHAHNDHTTDLESLLTLLHKYNEFLKGDEYSNEFSNTVYSRTLSKFYKKNVEEFDELVEYFFAFRRKKIKIFMTSSTFKKYAPLLDLSSRADYEVEIVNKNSRTVNLGSKMSFRPIFAKHCDLISDKESVGFAFFSESCCLIYTGDTGFNHLIKNTYSKLLENYLKDCFAKSDCSGLCETKKLVLLAHIGGFKQCENHAIGYSNYEKNYENHLGRLGLVQLADLLQPSICIVSEFGDEFRSRTKQSDTNRQGRVSPRIKLCELYEVAFAQAKENAIRFIPADIGLNLSLDSEPKIVIEGSDSGEPSYCNADDVVCEEDEFGYIQYKKESKTRV